MLSFDPVNFILMIINVLILFFIAKKFLFGRVDAVIAKRKEETDHAYKVADDVVKEATETKEEYERRIADIDAERDRKLREAENEAAGIKASIIENANKEAGDIISYAKTEAERLRSNAMLDHDRNVEDLVFDVASKLAGQTMTEEAHSELYERFLSEASGKSSK